MRTRSQISADVGPDFGAVGGAGDLSSLVGALLTYGLIVAVLMLVISASAWAIASSSGSWHTAQKAKVGCFVAIGAYRCCSCRSPRRGIGRRSRVFRVGR